LDSKTIEMLKQVGVETGAPFRLGK
jgi:hypothetical protein